MLTPRESALGVYTAARGMGRGTVRGADMREVTTERIRFIDNAVSVVQRAIDGPPKQFVREPDDDSLRAMLTNLQHQREALAPANT